MPPRALCSTTPKTSSSVALVQDALQWRCQRCRQRGFTSTASRPMTKLRREMFGWLNGPGKAFKEPLPGSTNYLGGYDRKGRLLRQLGKENGAKEGELEKETISDLRPFPLNQSFYSQSILSEELRNEIHRRVKILNQPVRLVSAQLGVEMRRVAAVVRLVDIEHNWKAEGKPLAIPYARAIHAMVPTTPLDASSPIVHESINDLPIHPATNPQIFWPTSESRIFNRTDAGRVFSGAHRLPDGDTSPSSAKPEHFEIVGKEGNEREVLLPADARIPHPHLIDYHKDKLNPDFENKELLVRQRYSKRIQDELEKAQAVMQRKRVAEEKATTRVQAGRWEFLFKEVQTTKEGTGLDGKGIGSPGFRYGIPHEDRKRGQVKIPTKVTV